MRNPDTGELQVDSVDRSLAGLEAAFDPEPDRWFVVAERDGRVIGVTGLQSSGIDPALYTALDKPVELVRVYVTRTELGTGVGRALADHMEDMARSMGFTKLIVESGARNREFGYRFWTKRYGAMVLFEPDVYGPGYERVAWTKSLVP